MGFCQHEAGGKEVSAFSDQAPTDGTCLRVVRIISIEEGKVRGSINKCASCLRSSAHPHTCLRGRYASARYVCLFSESLFEKYQAASRLSIKRVIATYTNVSLVLGNSS